MIDKEVVRSRFARAWGSYDREAHFQRQMAEELTALYPGHGSRETVLELGCGTGLFSLMLRDAVPAGSRFTFNDLSPEVFPYLEEKVGTGHTLLPGDAETIDWGGPYSLIASNASIQWWKEPLGFFRKASKCLSDGGRILLGTFLPDNFFELNSVTGCALRYPSPEGLRKALGEAGFSEIRLTKLREVYSFPGIHEMLRHIKYTGTNGLVTDTKGIWTPARLRELEEEFRRMNGLSASESLPLTYSALLLSAHKEPL